MKIGTEDTFFAFNNDNGVFAVRIWRIGVGWFGRSSHGMAGLVALYCGVVLGTYYLRVWRFGLRLTLPSRPSFSARYWPKDWILH